MIVSEMKELIASHSSNRADMSTVPLINRKIQNSLNYVVDHCTPLVLLKRQGSGRLMHKSFTKDRYICRPMEIVDDSSLVEIDEPLLNAVALHALSNIEPAKAQAYIRQFYAIVESYEYNLMNAFISLDEDRYIGNDSLNELKEVNTDLTAITSIDRLLQSYGLKNIYTDKIKRLTGYEYIWDDNFITLLNDYFYNKELVIDNLSDRINLDEYITYQISGVGDSDMYDKLNAYLGSLRKDTNV